jgi:hypothetical protein
MAGKRVVAMTNSTGSDCDADYLAVTDKEAVGTHISPPRTRD